MTDARGHTTSILTPADAAARIGLSVGRLVVLLKTYGYQFTEMSPGGKPGDRGRGLWGMTAAQVEAVVRGQARGFNRPAAEVKPPKKGLPVTSKSRVVYPKSRTLPT